jgi:hypothetical protein
MFAFRCLYPCNTTQRVAPHYGHIHTFLLPRRLFLYSQVQDIQGDSFARDPKLLSIKSVYNYIQLING